MNKPIKDWGSGIPKYSKDDILSGLELHEFCTNAVAQSMQDDGFTIEGVFVHNSPTQVIKGSIYRFVCAELFGTERTEDLWKELEAVHNHRLTY